MNEFSWPRALAKAAAALVMPRSRRVRVYRPDGTPNPAAKDALGAGPGVVQSPHHYGRAYKPKAKEEQS